MTSEREDVRDESRDDSLHQRGSYNFLRGVIKNNESEFTPVGIDKSTYDKVHELLQTSHSQTMERILSVVKDPELAKSLSPGIDESVDRLMAHSLRSGRGVHRVYHAYDRALIVQGAGSSFFVIAPESKDAEFVAEKISNEIKKISKVTRDLGVWVDNILVAKEYGQALVRGVANVNNIKACEPKNDFERVIAQKVDVVASSALPNIEVIFSSPPENFEYDILLPIASNALIDIEVKDFETVKGQIDAGSPSMKSQVILAPLDKARRLGAEPMIVANGFPKSTLAQMRELAESRKIRLLEPDACGPEISRLALSKLFSSTREERMSLYAEATRRMGLRGPIGPE